jgi:peptidyl-prolyl cis-trans isomerase D
MLLAIRERIMGVVGWVILGFLVIAFAFFGLNSYLQSNVVNYAAVVNGEEITLAQLQRSYERLRRSMEEQLGQDFDPALLDDGLLKANALQQLINRTLILQAAEDEGFSASNEQVAARINAIEAFRENGVFSKEKYEQILGYQGMRPAEFERGLQQDIIASQFTASLSDTAAVPEQNLSQAFLLEGQQRRFKYLILPLASVSDDVAVSEEEITAYFKDHADAFMTPERVRAQYLELDVATLDTGTAVDEEALQALYDEQASKYVTPEERHARHILVRLSADADAEATKAAREKADSILSRLNGGEEFSSLARELSDDPGSASNGGDLGFFGRGIMTPEFENVVFAMQPGEVSQPVRSPFGFHIIKLVEIKPEVATPLDEVRDELTAQLLNVERGDLFYENSETLSNLAFEQPDSLQAAADELGLEIRETGWVTETEGTGVAEHDNVRAALFSEDVLDNGNNSSAIEIGPDHVVVLRVVERQEAARQPLEAVREEIIQLLENQKARSQLATKGGKLLADLQDNAVTLTAVAEAESLEVQTTDLITRNAAEPVDEVVAAAFAAPEPESDQPAYYGTQTIAGDYIIVALEEVKAGDYSSLPAMAQEQLWSNLNRVQGAAEMAAVLSILKEQASIVIPDQTDQ